MRRSDRALDRQELPFGGRLGDYVLLEQVGLGRWCRVFRAVHRDGKGLRAVKLAAQAGAEPNRSAAQQATSLRVDRAADSVRHVALLQHEAEVATAVRHPKLVAIEDVQLEQSPYFLVLEWIDGESLAQRIAREGKLIVPIALWTARQVAEALDALFQKGFIHGDVKPQNILVRPGGAVKLIDLGLARRPDTPVEIESLRSASRRFNDSESGAARPEAMQPLAGTANYMAPELAAGTQAGDVRSDIYSLGVTLYEMLTGRLPFDAADLGAVLESQRRQPPKCPRRTARFLTPPLTSLLHVMLAKDPLRRPYPPRELITLLRRLEIDWLDYRNSA
jgi:serine/threonine protein kinase